MIEPNPFNELAKSTPDRCILPVAMKEPNEIIEIYSGEFALKLGDNRFSVSGDITFRWYPYIGVTFVAYTQKDTDLSNQIFENLTIRFSDVYELYIQDVRCGDCKITGYDFSNRHEIYGTSNDFVKGERNIAVNEVIFAVPNLRDYLGDSVKDVNEDGDLHFEKTRLTLECGPYKIVLDKLSNYKEQKDKLEEATGYLLLYAGKVTSSNDSINLSHFKKWLPRLNHFFYFLNGIRTAPLFLTGRHEGQNIWTDYSGNDHIESYKFTLSWSNIFFIDELTQLWNSFNKLWDDESDRDFIITAIHWYIEANTNSAKIEGSIILIQTALELLYNWLIVEKQEQIIGDDAKNLRAENKIRMLIFQLKISAKIPAHFSELSKILNIQDGPQALANIRNALIHGQKQKREDLNKISLQAKYEALQLGLWYVELTLLFILGYKGKYNNRTTGNIWRNSGSLVPWMLDNQES